MPYSAAELNRSLRSMHDPDTATDSSAHGVEMSHRRDSPFLMHTPRNRGLNTDESVTPSELVRQINDGELGDALKQVENAGNRLQELSDALSSRLHSEREKRELQDTDSENSADENLVDLQSSRHGEPPANRHRIPILFDVTTQPQQNHMLEIGPHEVEISETPRVNAYLPQPVGGSGQETRERLHSDPHSEEASGRTDRVSASPEADEEPFKLGRNEWPEDEMPPVVRKHINDVVFQQDGSHFARCGALFTTLQAKSKIWNYVEKAAIALNPDPAKRVKQERRLAERFRERHGRSVETGWSHPQNTQWRREPNVPFVGSAGQQRTGSVAARVAQKEEEKNQQLVEILRSKGQDDATAALVQFIHGSQQLEREAAERAQEERDDEAAEGPAFRLLYYLRNRKMHDKAFFFRFSPMGEVPLHLFYLFCIDILCMDIIQEVYTGVGHSISNNINLPYRNNLRWLADDKEIRERVLEPEFRFWRKTGQIPPDAEMKDVEDKSDASIWKHMGLFTGETTLHMAIANRRTASVEALLRMGADVNARATGTFFSPELMTPFRRIKDVETERERETGDASLPWRQGSTRSMNSPGPPGGFLRGSRLQRQESNASHLERLGKLRRHKFFYVRNQSLLRYFNRLHMVPNPTSTFYAGQLPFSFGAYVGSCDIMKLLLDSVGKVNDHDWKTMNAQDEFDNTALHMAVYGNSEEAFSWLMAHGAAECLTKMNVMGLTPVTLAASLGNSTMLMYIFRKHLSKVLWRFGEISALEIQLAQLDSFKMSETPKGKDRSGASGIPDDEAQYRHQEFVTEYKAWANGKQYNEARSQDAGPDFDSIVKHKVRGRDNRTEVDRMMELHKSNRYRSALEIIVSHQVDEIMTSEGTNEVKELMLKLINTKWERFAKGMHTVRRVIPYLSLLVLFTVTLVWKSSLMRQMTVFEEHERAAWVPQYEIVVACMEGAILVFGMPFLITSGYVNVRIKLSDLDVNMNNDISFSEIMIFTYKNMPSFLDFANAAGFAICAICRAIGTETAENVELGFASVVTVLLWVNLTSLLVPSRFFGSLVFIIYRTFVSDISKFLLIYMILNFAFGFSFFLLLQKGQYPQDDELQEAMLCKGCDIYVFNMILKLVYVSLGESDQSLLIESMREPTLGIVMHMVYAVMSLLLLLNLIIAMMGDTFQKGFKDSERDWFYPFAELVLMYEQMLPKEKQRLYRLGNTESRPQDDDVDDNQGRNKKLQDPFHYYMKIASSAEDANPPIVVL